MHCFESVGEPLSSLVCIYVVLSQITIQRIFGVTASSRKRKQESQGANSLWLFSKLSHIICI